jgi:transposase-like protein
MATPKRSKGGTLRPGPFKEHARQSSGHFTLVTGHAEVDSSGSVSFTDLKRRNLGQASNLKPGSVYLEIEPPVAKQVLAAGGLRLDLTAHRSPERERRRDRDGDRDIPPALRTALADAYDRGDVVAAGVLGQADMLSSDEIARRFGVTRETINQWRRRGDLLGLEGDARGVRYPEWQIVGGRRMPFLRTLAGFFGNDPWALYRFLAARHDGLDGKTGVEAMRAGRHEEVLALAESANHGAPA